MKFVLVLPWLAACLSPFDQPIHKNPLPSTPIVKNPEYYTSIAHGLVLDLHVAGEPTAAKALGKRLFLLRDPHKDTLAETDLALAIPIKLKKTGDARFKLGSKRALSHGVRHGLYFRDTKTDKIELIHSFFTLPKPVQLIDHSFKASEVIFSNQIIFYFRFDRPVFLLNENALSLVSLKEPAKHINIERFTITPDGTTCIVELAKEGALAPNLRYAFMFDDGLRDQYDQPVAVETIEFSTALPLPSFEELAPLSLRTSHQMVEVNWSLNQPHKSALLVKAGGTTFFKTMGSIAVGDKDDVWSYYLRSSIEGFDENTLYRFVLVNKDLAGRVITATGSFQTRKPQAIRISEVMINPALNGSKKESLGEYIEIANTENVAMALDDLRITVEDHKTLKLAVCALAHGEPLPELCGRGYALIVGSDFNEAHYGLDRSTSIIRLKQKTLCGGLANSHAKTIRLERAPGELIDRFSGHKWKTKEGQSVQRIDLVGLDDDHNYCYSAKDDGPTPLRPNGPCESSS